MTSNLTKRGIVNIIQQETGLPQDEVQKTVQLTLDTIASALCKGQKVELRNFGIFGIQIRKARVGRNPNEPEKDVPIPKRAVVKFKAGKKLKVKLQKMNFGATAGEKVKTSSKKVGVEDEDESRADPGKTSFGEKLKSKLKQLEELDF